MFPSRDPFTGEAVAEVAAGTRADAAPAAEAAAAVLPLCMYARRPDRIDDAWPVYFPF